MDFATMVMSGIALFINVDFRVGRVFANIWYLESSFFQNFKMNKSKEYMTPDTIFFNAYHLYLSYAYFITGLF